MMSLLWWYVYGSVNWFECAICVGNDATVRFFVIGSVICEWFTHGSIVDSVLQWFNDLVFSIQKSINKYYINKHVYTQVSFRKIVYTFWNKPDQGF